ncbi:MAG: hypothetical protein KC912_08130 [Proteobacteria bacterium]|nr:hypothetical protein [Pseudomonadota bacterium]
MQPTREEGRLTRLSAGIGRVFPRWKTYNSTQQLHAVLLFLLMVTTVVHNLIFVYWYIEDAAISFSYAKHFAEGEGFVTYPGGELVEGFSDPLWVYLMVIWEFFGVSGFTSSKIMGCVFGALTVPVAYWLANEALEAKPDKPSHWALIAPAYLAGSAQFAIWNASGLENSLFNFLLAMGMWRTIVETRSDKWPTSAAWFLALSITRPEGILYAAFGGFWAMVLSLKAHRSVVHTVKWLVTFFVPFTVYQVLRFSYFAWPFPNTYYAKLGSKEFMPFAWNARGWKYIRDWSHLLWHGYLIPVYLYGLLGRKRGVHLTLAGVLVIFMALQLPGPHWVKGFWPWTEWVAPAMWHENRVYMLLMLGLLLPLRALGGEGWRVRVLCWAMAFISLFFTLWSGGDWMKGFRWMSLLTVPSAVLFAAGSREIGPLLGAALAPVWVPAVTGMRVLARRGKLNREQLRKGIVGMGVLGLLICIAGPNIAHSNWFAKKPETGPFSVQKRVNYVNWVERRLHLEHRPTTFDVDMGANMYWSGNKIADVAGLVDVSMGHHNYEPEFMKEYLFEDIRPEFVHSHGGWASRSRVQTYPQWKEQYFELPGYPTGKRGLHIGNWVRKDLFLEKGDWPAHTTRHANYDHGIRVTGLENPVPAGQGMHLYLELGVALDKLPQVRGKEWEARITAFITNGNELHSWSLPIGYDWYRPSDFQPDETFRGRFSLKLPKRLAPGDWDLGWVVTGPDGTAVAPVETGEALMHAGTEGFVPQLATTEVRIGGAVTILAEDQALAEAEATYQSALAKSQAGDCPAAEALWHEMRLRTTRRDAFFQDREATYKTTLAQCHVDAAAATEDEAEKTRLLIAAKEADHHLDGYRRAATRHGENLYQAGHTALAEGEWALAQQLFTDSVLVDPKRSFSRRYAEAARDLKLGIDPLTVQKKKDEAAADAETRRLRREKLAEDRKVRREKLGLETPEAAVPNTEQLKRATVPPPLREPREDE